MYIVINIINESSAIPTRFIIVEYARIFSTSRYWKDGVHSSNVLINVKDQNLVKLRGNKAVLMIKFVGVMLIISLVANKPVEVFI